MDAIRRHKALIIITAMGALLRLSTLTVESMWYDETFTAWLAGLPLPQLWDATMGDVHPPTWYIIERGMVLLLGRSEFSLRIISALAGIALIPAVYRLARSFDRLPREALQAAALAAVAPFLVQYSQEARAYSLIYLLTTLATIAMLDRRWLLLTLSAAAALYLHNLTVFYIAALGWLALWRYRLDWRPLLALAAAALLWAPWVFYGLLPQAADVADGFWVRTPTWGTPFFILTGWLFSEKALLFVAVSAPVLAIGLGQALNRPDPHRWPLLALLLLPLAGAVIVSVVVAPVVVARVIGSSAVVLVLLLAPALIPAEVPRRDWPTVSYYALPAAFFLIVAALYPIWYTSDRIGRYPWDYGLAPVLDEIQPGDGLFHANLGTYIVLDYYLPQDQWVWLQANDLSQSLTNQTKWAMQMQQAQFEEVRCLHPRWYLAFYENPTTDDRERAEVARLVEKYHGEQITTILDNQLVNARVYRLANVCPEVASND